MRATEAVRLLELDPELGDGLSAEETAQAAGRLVVPVFVLGAGPVEIDEVRDSPDVENSWALYVCSGFLLNRLQLHTRVCAQLFGPGDLVLMDGSVDESLTITMGWHVAQETRVAVLEDRALVAGRYWPRLLEQMHQRAALVARRGFIERGISQLPRVEERLLAFLWAAADRFGRVTADGTVVQLPVSHEDLGQLIGAQRSTVSLGLSVLTEKELVRREGAAWRLLPGSLRALDGHQAIMEIDPSNSG